LRQLDKKKGERIAEWKAEGVEYEERMRRLEEVTWDKPKAELLYTLFDVFAEAHPWVGDNNVRPKSILRDMAERYMSFNEYVKELGLERIEGTLLRYLSEGFKALVHTVPSRARTDELVDLIAFYRTVLSRVDSSLIQEWERLMYGEEAAAVAEAALPLDITKDKRAFSARVRSELHALVKALAAGDYEEAARAVRQPDDDAWTPERFEAALRPLLEEHARIVFDHGARLADKTRISAQGRHEFAVTQVLVLPPREGYEEEEAEPWMIEGRIDLRADTAPEGPMITVTRIGGS
jgi:hypothetical protein